MFVQSKPPFPSFLRGETMSSVPCFCYGYDQAPPQCLRSQSPRLPCIDQSRPNDAVFFWGKAAVDG